MSHSQETMAATENGPEILQASPRPFEVTHGEFLESILPLSRPVHYRRGQAVLLHGSQSRNLFYLERGAVEVSYLLRETRIVVALIGSGTFFGEIGFFDGISRVRDIRATEDALIRIFDEATLTDLQSRDPLVYSRFVTYVAQSICAKFRRVLEEREPLQAYAASLSTGGRRFEESKPLPPSFFGTPEWRRVNQIVEDFKADIFDLSYRLQQDPGQEPTPEDFTTCFRVLESFNDQLEALSAGMSVSNASEHVWGYVFKEIFPYFMRSRFAERAYFKPRGYPGDYLMMEMIYRNQPEGDGKLGVTVDHWCLNSPSARAVRGRRDLLSRKLAEFSRERLDGRRPIRIMNLACGPSRELFDFLERCDYAHRIETLCVDADPDALEFSNRALGSLHHRGPLRFLSENVVKWALGRIRHHIEPQDIIYSAGLTDYLDRKPFLALVRRCYDQLRPGGVLIIGNFAPANPNRAFMDHVLHWRLIHRDEAELRALFEETPFGANVEVLSEPQKVNLFAVARRTA